MSAPDAPDAPDAPAPAPVNALITTDLAISLVACHTKTEDRLACDNPFCVRVWNHADSNGASNDHDYLAAPMVRAMRDKGLKGARRTDEDAAASGRRRFRLLRDTGVCEQVCLACHGANLPNGTTIKTHVVCSDCREENAHVCAGGSCLACEVASQLSTAPAPAPEPAEPAAAGRSLRRRPAKAAAKVGRTASRSFQPLVGRALTKSMPAHVCEGVMRVVEEHSKQGANIDAVRTAKDDALRDAEGAQSGKRRRADAIAARKRLQKVVDEEKEALEAFQIACAMKDRAWFGVTREVVLNPLRAEEDEPHFKPCMDDDDEFDADALEAEDQEGVLEEMGAITLGVDAECLREIKVAQHDLENPESPTPGPSTEEFQARNKSNDDLRERLDAFRAKAPVTAEKYFGPAPDDEHHSSVDERYGQAYDRLEAALKAYRVTVKETVPDLSVVADDYDGPTPGKRRRTAADPDVPLTAAQQEKKDAADAKKERDKRVRDELKDLMASDVAQALRKQKEQAWKEEYAAEHGEACAAYDPKKVQAEWEGFDPSVTIREVVDAQREEEAEEAGEEEAEAEAEEAEAEAEEAGEAGEAGAEEAEAEEAEEAEAEEAEEPTVLASEYEAYKQRKQAQLRCYQQFLKDRNLTAEFKAYRQSQMVVPE